MVSINQSINHQRCWSRHLYLPNRFHQPQWNSTNPILDQPIVVQCKMTGTILISTPILLRASRHSTRSGTTPTKGSEVNSHIMRESERLPGTHHLPCIKDFPPQPASHGAQIGVTETFPCSLPKRVMAVTPQPNRHFISLIQGA